MIANLSGSSLAGTCLLLRMSYLASIEDLLSPVCLEVLVVRSEMNGFSYIQDVLFALEVCLLLPKAALLSP